MSVITSALQAKPEAVVLQTTTVLDIAKETGTIDVSLIRNPKNCGFDYVWFENAEGKVVKVKIGAKAAPIVAGKTQEETLAHLINSKMPIYVNTTSQDGTALARPVFTFAPAADFTPTAKFSFNTLMGKQELENVKK